MSVELLFVFMDIISHETEFGVKTYGRQETAKDSSPDDIINEIEVMYKLKGNSNIVTYEDHAINRRKDGQGWDILIRTEYLKPLPDYTAAHELSGEEVIKLGVDICKALEVWVKEHIIHRDVKDVNIFVSKSGDFKLGNFGPLRPMAVLRFCPRRHISGTAVIPPLTYIHWE